MRITNTIIASHKLHKINQSTTSIGFTVHIESILKKDYKTNFIPKQLIVIHLFKTNERDVVDTGYNWLQWQF